MGKRHVARLGGFIALALVGFTLLGPAVPHAAPLQIISRAYGGEAVLASDLDNAADTLELPAYSRSSSASAVGSPRASSPFPPLSARWR